MTKRISEHDQLVLALALILRTRRKALDISQTDLASQSGIHRSYIGGFEGGARNISVKNLSRLAFTLGLSVSKMVRLAETRAAAQGSFKPKKRKPRKASQAYGGLTVKDVTDAMKTSKKTKAELAKALGISRYFVSLILAGARPFTPALKRKWLRVFADWHDDF